MYDYDKLINLSSIILIKKTFGTIDIKVVNEV